MVFQEKFDLYALTLLATCPAILKQCFNRFSTTDILMGNSENRKSSFPRFSRDLTSGKPLENSFLILKIASLERAHRKTY